MITLRCILIDYYGNNNGMQLVKGEYIGADILPSSALFDFLRPKVVMILSRLDNFLTQYLKTNIKHGGQVELAHHLTLLSSNS